MEALIEYEVIFPGVHLKEIIDELRDKNLFATRPWANFLRFKSKRFFVTTKNWKIQFIRKKKIITIQESIEIISLNSNIKGFFYVEFERKKIKEIYCKNPKKIHSSFREEINEKVFVILEELRRIIKR